MMEIEIEGKKFHCLLDSGCDHSLIPRSMLPDMPYSQLSVKWKSRQWFPYCDRGLY